MKCPLDYHLPSVFSIQRFTSFPLQYYQYKEKRLKNKIHNTFKRALSDICLIRLRKKCPYSELFWSAFSRLRTEYGVSLRIQSECGKMRTRITPNTDTFHAVTGNGMNEFIMSLAQS